MALQTGQAVADTVLGVCSPRETPTRWIRIDAIPLFRAGEEAPYQVYAIFDDITEHRRAEMERERLMAAIEQTGDIVMITDPEGTIQYLNSAFETVTGYRRRDAVGQNPRLLKSGKQAPAFYGDLWEAISSGRRWTGRMVNKRADGKLYTEEATISPVVDALGRIVNYVAVKRDITEHLQLEQQFQQAMKMEAVGRLAGGVAHDLNNALTPLLGIGGILLRQMRPGTEWYDDVMAMRDSGERCANLTRQLLAFSRSETMEVTVFNLNDVVANMVKMLSRVIGEDIELIKTIDPELGRVRAGYRADGADHRQSGDQRPADAMPNGGRLIMETENITLDEEYASEHPGVVPGPHVMLAVSDTGTGMDEETKARIFEPFFSTKEKGKGTGLGLSTVHGIVKQSGGRIEVASELGKGTTFTIYLPCVEGEAEETKSRQGAIAEHDRGSGTILLVEDEDGVRMVAKRILCMHGYAVLEADSGEQALELSESHQGPIDLAITDVVMPGMSGTEMAKQLSASRPGIGVLYISGYTDETIVNHGVLVKGAHFLRKPFAVESLTAKVREMLDLG